MRRFRDDRPGDICFARGTFNAHPYVMGAMHEFKRVWRGLATVGKIRAEEAEPILDLRFTVENEGGECASRLFPSSLFPPSGDWSLRMHLRRQ